MLVYYFKKKVNPPSPLPQGIDRDVGGLGIICRGQLDLVRSDEGAETGPSVPFDDGKGRPVAADRTAEPEGSHISVPPL